VPFGGSEKIHQGRYDILPITPAMEWVPAKDGRIPKGVRPVEGGYESDGKFLYHAYATINGCKVPGKVGAHLEAAHVPFGGKECREKEYHLLVWKH